MLIPGLSMLGATSEPSAWLQRRDIRLGTRDRPRPDQEKAYDDHVAGRPVLDTVEEALAIIR
jgi:hypothetical protein